MYGRNLWALYACILGQVLPQVCELARVVSGIRLPPVHWNASNPLFERGGGGRTIEVSLCDQIDFVCPYYPSENADPSVAHEYYLVYQVDKQNFDDCRMSSQHLPLMIVNCSNPFHPKRFTILFETFQAIPNVPEFVAGGTYYYITTSTGSRDGLFNTHLGACRQHNMKLSVHVCCDSSSVESSAVTSSSALPPFRHLASDIIVSKYTTPRSKSRSSLSGDTPSEDYQTSSNFNIPLPSNSRKPSLQGVKDTKNNSATPKHEGLMNCTNGRFHGNRTTIVLQILYVAWLLLTSWR